MKPLKVGLVILLIVLLAYLAKKDTRTQAESDTVPIINSDVEEIQIPCQYTEEDLLQGLTAYDAEDGYITEKILAGSFSDFTQPGVSSVEYAVYDSDNNMATLKRKVVFSDYHSPKISITEPLVFPAAANVYNIPSLSEYLEGTDQMDGDISRHILLSSEDMDFAKPGKYTLSVYLKNSFGDAVNMDLPVHILDPAQSGIIIELEKPLLYVEKGAAFNPKQYITAIRNQYTNEILSEKNYKLTVDSGVDTSKDGIYEVQFSAISADKVQHGETWLTVIVGEYGG